MKRFPIIPAAFLALAVALLVPTSCAGLAARTEAMKTIATAYATIVQPILLVGIGAEQDAGRLSEAKAQLAREAVTELGKLLDGGDVGSASLMRVAWEKVMPFALAGIDARIAKGEIGPGVGASLKETVRLFGERLLQLQQ